MSLERNDLCYCGSGKKYKKCHLELDLEAQRALGEALPVMKAKMAKARQHDVRLRDEYGVYINYVSPLQFQGRKVWAIGSRLYLDRPPNETFHEFILMVLRETLGEEWRSAQADLPAQDQHFIFRCFQHLTTFKARHIDPEQLARHGRASTEPDGWIQYLVSLAWDVATLIHAGKPPQALIDRLRDRNQFQGARYEIAIAAIFARLNCSIRFLDDDPELRGTTRVEFEATHRPTGQTVAVEVKSRHRKGVLHQVGEPDAGDPLKKDARMVRQLFVRALKKAPESLPFFVFIDINAPSDTNERWKAEVQAWITRLAEPTPDTPDTFNALYVTNFSPHYDADSVHTGGSWLAALPNHVLEPLEHEIRPALHRALETYGRVPSFAEEGTLLE